MKTVVIEERIDAKMMFFVHYWTEECYEELEIYASDLKKAKVGDVFKLDFKSNIGCEVRRDSLNIIYKSDRGVAAILMCEGITYDPLPEEWEEEDMLIWFQFR